MKRNRLLVFFSCTAVLAAAVLFLHHNEGPEQGDGFLSPEKTKSHVIGVSVLDMRNPYYMESVRGMRDAAAMDSTLLLLRDPGSDAQAQCRDLREFIDKKVDAILVAALSPELVEPLLEEAMRSGIKVVAQATKLKNCDIHIAADEWDMGFKLGLEASGWIRTSMRGSAEVAILGYPRIPEIANRVKGMRDGLLQGTLSVKVVEEKSASNAEEGYKAMMEVLKDHPDIQMVLCINDGGALGALRAMEELGKVTETTFIGGVDATPEAMAAMERYEAYRCSVDIYPYLTGSLCVDFARRLMEGESVPERYTVATRVVKHHPIL